MAPNKLNWSLLDTTARSMASGLGLDGPRQAFPVLVVSNVLTITRQEAVDTDTDGPNDRGIDALYFDERDNQLRLHLFNFKYRDDFANADSSFPGAEVDKIIVFIDDLINLRAEKIKKTCHPVLADKVEYLWDKIVSPSFEIVVHLCSNGARLNPVARRNFDAHFGNSTFISMRELDTDDIVEQMVRAKDVQVDGQMQLLENQYFPRIDGNIRGLIATIRAAELVQLLRDPAHQSQINTAAFNENIRLYLGNRNEVNKSILATAVGMENREFWYLNNGITIVCEQFKYNDVASPVVALRNFQIVNGGQTANALFEAYHQNPERVSNVYLLARIYEASGADIKLKIAAATNNQTRINSRDLRSNDPIQKRLEEGLGALGYLYERKKDQYQDKPVNVRIDALHAGQTYLAYYEKEPDKAKTQSNRIFGDWYQRIFNAEITPQKLLCPVLLASEIAKRKIGIRRAVRGGLSREIKDEFLLEGGFHALYVVGLLCTKNNTHLDDFTAAKEYIDDAIRITRETALKFKGKSYYKFFRSADSKDILFRQVFDIEPPLL